MPFPFDAGLLQHIISDTDHPAPPGGDQFVATSVFMLIFNKNQTPCLLTVLKANNQGYPWRNQVALPGGHVDASDSSSLGAAYRETQEELRIAPDLIELVGSLGHFQTIQQKDIEVFLGVWQGSEHDIYFDPSEIARVLTPSIPILLKRHLDQQFNGRIPGVGELIYPIDDLVIWGVTARIVHYFLELIRIRLPEDSLNTLLAAAGPI
ncbi:MAG TPA: CoA pyrophosphatase [Desulfosalsimonadaceae bacterium]|nr:CoA pyrophosphatase [Desulfosalsimonadaceae bacterium]